MFIVKFTGGLGNQIYIYCVYEWLKRRYPGFAVKADTDRYIYQKYKVHSGFELTKVFKGIDLDIATTDEILRCGGEYERHAAGPIDIVRRFYINKIRGIRPVEDSKWAELKSLPDEELKGKDLWLNLWWDSVEDGMMPELKYDNELVGINGELADAMNKGKSVSVHIRRGDYVGTSFDKFSMDYYISAMERFRAETDSPRFYIFSDDKGFADEYFSAFDDCAVVRGNEGDRSYLDMQLMSSCTHNIICNSTFSAWAAFLNPNPDKMIVAPKGYLTSLPANCSGTLIEI